MTSGVPVRLWHLPPTPDLGHWAQVREKRSHTPAATLGAAGRARALPSKKTHPAWKAALLQTPVCGRRQAPLPKAPLCTGLAVVSWTIPVEGRESDFDPLSDLPGIRALGLPCSHLNSLKSNRAFQKPQMYSQSLFVLPLL